MNLLTIRDTQIISDTRFRLVACQNSVHLPGRKALPSELTRRFVKFDVGTWAKTKELQFIFQDGSVPNFIFDFKHEFDEEFPSCQLDIRSLKRWKSRVCSTNSAATNQKWAQCGYEVLYGQVASVSQTEGPKKLKLLLEKYLGAVIDEIIVRVIAQDNNKRLVLQCSDTTKIILQCKSKTPTWTEAVQELMDLPQNALQCLYLCLRSLETGHETPVIVGESCFKSTVASLIFRLAQSDVTNIWVSLSTSVSNFLGKLVPVPLNEILKHVFSLLPEESEINTAVDLWCRFQNSDYQLVTEEILNLNLDLSLESPPVQSQLISNNKNDNNEDDDDWDVDDSVYDLDSDFSAKSQTQPSQ